MLTSILNFREILQTLGQSITRPLPDPMEFIVMDAFLVILVLYVFLFIRKIVRLCIRLVKRLLVQASVDEPRIISRRTAEAALSKAEAAKQLLAASRKTKNPFKLLRRLFRGLFEKLSGWISSEAFKGVVKSLVKLVSLAEGFVRRKIKKEPAATSEGVQLNRPVPAPTYETVDGTPPAAVVTSPDMASEPDMEPAPSPQPMPADPIPPTPAPVVPPVAEPQSPVHRVVPPAMPAASTMPVEPVATSRTTATVETPVRAADLLPQPAVPEPHPSPAAVSVADETALTAAFEQELRNAQQAETQLRELKVKAAATALQKGSLAANRSVEEALPWYEKAAELDPASATVQLGLSRLYKETGNLLGAFEAAQKAFAGSHDQQAQSLALESMDQVIVAKTDEPVAPEPAPRSLAEITRLLETDPDNPDLQRDLSIAYDEIGDQHAEQDNLIGALECFEASLMIIGRLAKAYPDNTVYLRDFSICQEKIGKVQNALGNGAAAIAAYEESLPIVTMLANRFPDEEEHSFDLKITKDRLAELKAIA